MVSATRNEHGIFDKTRLIKKLVIKLFLQVVVKAKLMKQLKTKKKLSVVSGNQIHQLTLEQEVMIILFIHLLKQNLMPKTNVISIS